MGKEIIFAPGFRPRSPQRSPKLPVVAPGLGRACVPCWPRSEANVLRGEGAHFLCVPSPLLASHHQPVLRYRCKLTVLVARWCAGRSRFRNDDRLHTYRPAQDGCGAVGAEGGLDRVKAVSGCSGSGEGCGLQWRCGWPLCGCVCPHSRYTHVSAVRASRPCAFCVPYRWVVAWMCSYFSMLGRQPCMP